MASIDSVYNALRTAIPAYTGFTTKKEIPNPYDLEGNPDQYLEDSWGLIMGAGSRSDKDVVALQDYTLTTNRPISIILTRRVYDVHNLGLAVSDEVNNLLLDAKTIRNNFLDLSKFGVLRGGEEIIYIGDTGVNFINTEKLKLISTQIDFEFEIVEKIN